VRPRLEELTYSTFHFRVEHDPIDAVRRAMTAAGLIPRKLRGERMPDQLRAASTALAQPIVLFFDQFEAFFIQSRGLEVGGAGSPARVLALIPRP
jgi:hypothetical protein